MSDRYQAPTWWRTVLELRAPFEFVGLLAAMPLRRRLPPGDGHTVLVIPGFLAPDTSTLPLRRILGGLGYEAVGWGLGVNKGPRGEIIEGIQRRLDELTDSSGDTVSIVGWSLGGLYARMLARAHPGSVRGVVTLVSPFRMVSGDRSRASRAYRLLEHAEDRHIWRRLREPPLTVPATSLFTKLDGVVDWRACVDDDRPLAESIEVVGASHFGMGHNPGALVVIADRLAQVAGAWRPFETPRPLRRVLIPHHHAESVA